VSTEVVEVFVETNEVVEVFESADTILEIFEGSPGDRGMSAYEVAVENGFTGNEDQWLASLQAEVVASNKDLAGWFLAMTE
jgi:hypothetical protein